MSPGSKQLPDSWKNTISNPVPKETKTKTTNERTRLKTIKISKQKERYQNRNG